MKIAYFDCPSGISGNMILGALIDAGLEVNFLKKELAQLPVTNYQLLVRKVKKQEIVGTLVKIKIKGKEKPRCLNELLSLIYRSNLAKTIQHRSAEIFKRLAEAEAKVHGTSRDQVHFHEVGATDALIDIVGTCLGIEKLGIEKIYCSPLPLGKGKVKYHKGYLPNPAPATAELLKNVPVYGTNLKGELITPTGAAIITTLASGFGDVPRI
ncbi:MAG: LarC family nickel insertion protein, partial [Candidatus Margulisiibacteriota bacterium]